MNANIPQIIAEIADREAISPSDVARFPDLLTAAGIDPTQVGPSVLHRATELDRKAAAKIRQRAQFYNVYGPAPQVVRWMARDGWTPGEAEMLLASYGIAVAARPYWLQGRRGEGQVAQVPREAAERLYQKLEDLV